VHVWRFGAPDLYLSNPYVGYIAKPLDTEGNLICGMQNDNSAR